ncbi:MAG: hypothetical protein PVF05_11900 [Gemmatimonadales bacterium]|jgi:hypothetical protein
MAAPGGAAQHAEKGRRGGLAGLLIGLVLGALATIFLPRFAGPYMPAALRGDEVQVSGVVQAKSAEPERLLLTVASESGAMLVTFKKKVAEIDQLVSVGDSVQLTVDEYAPFVEDAKISRVMKRGDWRPSAAEAEHPIDTGGAGRAARGDTAVPGDTAAPGTAEGAIDTNGAMNENPRDTAEAGDSTPPVQTP